MPDDIFSERRRALEETFYAKKNQELLAKLRDSYSNQQKRDQLAAASGISDPAVLDELLSLGVEPEAFTALSLVPLVLLAWADDFVDPKERHQVLKTAEKDGMNASDPSYALLETWLNERPSAKLLDHWKSYVAALKLKLPADSFATIHDQLMGRARRVAQSAGGLFGLRVVSDSEKKLLDELEQAFK